LITAEGVGPDVELGEKGNRKAGQDLQAAKESSSARGPAVFGRSIGLIDHSSDDIARRGDREGAIKNRQTKGDPSGGRLTSRSPARRTAQSSDRT
jgi:hypothetical protein